MLEKAAEITPRYTNFMHLNLKYSWGQFDTHTNEEKSDKEHIISYLMSRCMYGRVEKLFYQEVVQIPTKNLKMKEKKKFLRIQNRKTDRTNRGMIIWLAEALEAKFDLKKAEEEQFKSLINELNNKLMEIESID